MTALDDQPPLSAITNDLSGYDEYDSRNHYLGEVSQDWATRDGEPPRVADEVRSGSSWRPVDLDPALQGEAVEPPTILRRSDGLALFYRGRTHWAQGEPETLKSWVNQVGAAEQLNAGHGVLYVDFEDDDRGVVARLIALGVSAQAIKDHLTYVRPDEPIRPGRDGRFTPAQLDFEELICGRPTLVIIDGVTEAMGVEGLDLISNQDIAEWMRLVPKRIATATGAAVVCIDHVTKNAEGRGRFAIGGQHKLAGVTGAAYSLKLLKPFARSNGRDPVEGAVLIKVEKDRPGFIRGRAIEGKIAVLELTSWPDGGVTARLAPPTEGEMAPSAELVDRIVTHLVTYSGASMTAIEKDVQGNGAALREALRWLVEQGRVEVLKVGQAHRHYLVDEVSQP